MVEDDLPVGEGHVNVGGRDVDDPLGHAIVGVGGSTSALLNRSLRGMDNLIDNTLAGVRLDSGIQQCIRVCPSGLLASLDILARPPHLDKTATAPQASSPP